VNITGRWLGIITSLILVSNGLSPVFGNAIENVTPSYTENSEDETFVMVDRSTFEFSNIPSFSQAETVYIYDNDVLLRMGLTTLDNLKKQGIKVRELAKRTTLYVNDYVFDFIQGEPFIPENLKADPLSPNPNQMFLVHFVGPITNQWIDSLEATGTAIINYIPNFAYQVMMTQHQKSAVELLPFVDWVGNYHPAYKLSPELETDNISISLISSPTELDTLSAISQLVQVRSTFMTPDGYNVVARATNRGTIEAIARMEDIRYIGPHYNTEFMDEVGVQIAGGFWDSDNPSQPYRDTGNFGAYANHLGYTGKGVTVAICDSGIGDGTVGDSGHLDFTGRVTGGMCYGGFDSWEDPIGHGTHVAGLVGANGYNGTGVTYAGHGPYYTGMGLAYNATFYIQRASDDEGEWVGPYDFYEIARDGYAGGGVIHQDSWGDYTYGAYWRSDEAFDRAVRDADDTLDGNQEMTMVLAIGNEGPELNTVGSPGSGKNVIGVGAVLNYMPDSDIYGENWAIGGDPDLIASFSSRGWTDDNRIKPDIVAPGEAVLSTRPPNDSELEGVYTEDDRYIWASGTSMATPTVSGAAAVLYEWYQMNYGKEPSPAVLKALLINSAVDIGVQDIPNRNEGWGRVYIPPVIDTNNSWKLHDQEHELTTGLIDEFRIMHDEPSKPLKITLVYTDRYALNGDFITLKNQVNLEVISPSGDVYHGNAFSEGWTPANTIPNSAFDTDGDGYDDRNNVESVYIPTGELQPGIYTVRVIGSNIVADADNDGANDQDYALVMFNAVESVPWSYNWISLGNDSIGDGTLGDATLNITEIKGAYNSDYLFIRLVLEGALPKLTDNSWWVYLDLTADGDNDWLVEERPDASGGVFSYQWNAANGNWTLNFTSTVSDMDNDGTVRNITVGGSGFVDFAIKQSDYPDLDINTFRITAATDELDDLNLSGDTNRNPTDTSDPSCSDVVEFDDSAGPFSFINDPPIISTTDIIIATEDDFYFVNYDASDTQGDRLRWSLNTNASFLSIGTLSGFLKGIPTNADVGAFWVNVTVTDPGGLSDSHNFTLTVINNNIKILTKDLKAAQTDVLYFVDYDTDEVVGSITWSLATSANWLSINSSSGVLNGTPTSIGYHWVNVSVFDGNGGSDFHNFTLRVFLSHPTISIYNNIDFAEQAVEESWPGSGTPFDPYIIEGYGIDANQTSHAIYISHTTVHFEVRDNFLHNGSVASNPFSFYSGIHLSNVTNGLVENNTISNNFDGVVVLQSPNGNNTISHNIISNSEDNGIEIRESPRNTISNNTISYSGEGIEIRMSNHTTIRDNIILHTDYYNGITLYSSSNNTLDNNVISDIAARGIYFSGGENNYVLNNTISNTREESIELSKTRSNVISNNNILGGIILRESQDESIINNTITQGIYIEIGSLVYWNTHTITSNTVGGRPIFYWKNRNGGSIPPGAGQVILANCTEIIIENQEINSTLVGIELGFSDNITIADNTISDTEYWGEGIGSYSSSNVTIVNNTIFRTTGGGIYIYGKNNRIISNNISNNDGHAIYFRGSKGIIANNNIYSNLGDGISLDYSSYNTISNNTISNNFDGIDIDDSHYNMIDNNTIRHHVMDRGIHLARTTGNILTNNTLAHGGIVIQGEGLQYWDTHIINTTNTVNGKPVYYWKNRTGGTIPSNAGEVILVNCTNVLVESLDINDGGIIIVGYSNSNLIINNTISNNYRGLWLYSSNNNNIYHNNFIYNKHEVIDNGINRWNLSYPLGGNYWSDYTGLDRLKGSNQNIVGSDGIGDTLYSIDSNSIDYYPLMQPYKPLEDYTILKQGWNLISIPLIQEEQNLTRILGTIDGWYDAVQWDDPTDSYDPWKHYKVGKTFGNDLFGINETMGFWIHITNPGDTIFMYNGTQPTSNQSILLNPGWNLVGYPSLKNRTRDNALNNLNFSTDIDSIWTFNAATQKWEEIGPTDYIELGRGYWIHSRTTKVWDVPL
jgi:parallel beta-helix repeat protein